MNRTEINEIEVNGVKYIKKDSMKPLPSVSLDGKKYVIVRAKDSGCHAGYLESSKSVELTTSAVLFHCRRLWYWSGAASLSQLAMEGVSKPDECKFAMAVDKITVFGVCEIIETTKRAQDCIEAVKEWKA